MEKEEEGVCRAGGGGDGGVVELSTPFHTSNITPICCTIQHHKEPIAHAGVVFPVS